MANASGVASHSLSEGGRSAIEGVRDLVRRGLFTQARELLKDRNDAPALIQRAQLALHENDLRTARCLAGEANRVAACTEDHLLAIAVLDCVLASMGERGSQPISARDVTAVSPEAADLITYFLGCAAYLRSDPNSAESRFISRAPTSVTMRARYMIARGWVCAAQEHFDRQVALTLGALDLLTCEAPDEYYLIGNAAQALAILSRDLPPADLQERLEALSAGLLTDEIGVRFHVLRALAWARALHGDYEEASMFIARAMTGASSKLERLYACLDQASLAIFCGEQFSNLARSIAHLADQYARSINWELIAMDDIVALPLTAQVLAEFGITESARRYCALAERLQGNIGRRFALAHGVRFQAFLDEAYALTLANDSPGDAVVHALRGYTTFARIGFQWRAARMALLLYQIGRKSRWRTRAEQHLERYPRSPFHRVLSPGVGVRGLTQRQQQVLRLACHGFAVQRIATELRISPNTVRVHLGNLHWIYGVRNRAELIAKLASA